MAGQPGSNGNARTTCRRLEGRVVVVTASTDGIDDAQASHRPKEWLAIPTLRATAGLAIAERAAEEGATVIISSRKPANVDRVVADLRARGLTADGIPCHMGKTEDIQRLISETIKRHGRIDGLVSNAAVSPAMGPISGLGEAEWDKIFSINLRAAWLLVREATPYLNSGASVLFVASTASYNPSFPLGAYGVSKTALLGLTKVFAQELGPSNIRVNCLAPGLIKTRFSEELWKSDEISSRALSNTSLGRIGISSEMGGVAVFLLSDDASYVTGETIVASGGTPGRL